MSLVQPEFEHKRPVVTGGSKGVEAGNDLQIESSGVSVVERWHPEFNPWLIAVVVAMAAFMEVLDTSIANVALPYMAGNLGASNDESTWVLTSYLVSNAIGFV